MCGIVGFWKPSGYPAGIEIENDIKAMTDSLIHRGPDDSGYYVDKKSSLALGHRRLAIIDLTNAGHQPMESFSGRFVIVYNGEIYNFGEIKEEILKDRNIAFRGNSDTEVILAAVEIWGIEKTLKKLNGMFAFALWDKKEKKLFLARDRIGIKPLYYGVNNGIFFFASELKAIRKNPHFKPALNMEAVSSYFRLNYIPTPFSVYEGIFKLKPGKYLSVNDKLEIKRITYWSAEEITVSGQKNRINATEEDVILQLEHLLKDSVKKRMIADVPLGAFLSGGIDSSTVVALMQAQSSIPVKTFTIGFYEEGYNEAQFAKDVAKHLGTDHTELYVTPKEAMDVIPKLADMYDEPFADASQIPTFLVSQLTRKYVTVSLSGDGGDELFGGYNRYFWATRIHKKIRAMPFFARKWATKIMRGISAERWDRLFGAIEFLIPKSYRVELYGDKLHKVAEILNSKSLDEIYKRLISSWKEPAVFTGTGEPKLVFDDVKFQKLIPNFQERIMFFDLVTYLVDDILVKVDRASMAVSLEARVPLLDHRVVEYSKRLPLEYKIRNGQGKWILRQVLYRYVPKELIERPKMGFGVPIDKWLRGPLKEWAEDLLHPKKLKESGIVDPDPIVEKWHQHLSAKGNWQYYLWNILMYQSWFEKWM